MPSTWLKEIRSALKKNADLKVKEGMSRYFKESIKPYGVKRPIAREIARDFFNSHKQELSLEKAFSLAHELGKSGWMEEFDVALFLLFRLKKQFTKETFTELEKLVDRYVMNWAHCDEICTHCINFVVEKFPELLPELKRWTASPNLWKRRAACVSLVPSARHGVFLKEVFEIAEPVMQDKEDMVQKGVGWLLKETSKSHQKEVIKFLEQWKHKTSRVTLCYAIEKMSQSKRKKLLAK